jgi:hypothetical protein
VKFDFLITLVVFDSTKKSAGIMLPPIFCSCHFYVVSYALDSWRAAGGREYMAAAM